MTDTTELSGGLLRVHKIVGDTTVEGPGRRAAVWLKGCTLACPGCQAQHLWAREGGDVMPASAVADILLAENQERVSILGGEPFQQLRGLFALVLFLRKMSPSVHIVIYSGYTLEELQAGAHLRAGDNASMTSHRGYTDYILLAANVLVDGRFVRELDHDLLQYRGSANQRVIDLPATAIRRVLDRDPALVVTIPEWDELTLTFTPEGMVRAPAGALAVLGLDFDSATATRRCGQIA